MTDKLTLRLEKKVIERAKKHAKANNTSLSKLVEKYFEFMTSEDKQENHKTSPIIEEITGIVDEKDFSGNEREEYLMEKYS